MRAEWVDAAAEEHVEVADVEQRLAAMWRDGEQAPEGAAPVAWVRVLNLVVYTEDAGALVQVERLADTLPVRHPCRIIVVHIDPDYHGDRLDASISARCARGAGGRREVCCEVITLTASAADRRFASNAVASLLVSGLPVAVWWTGAPRPQDEVFAALTAELADRVIVDSRAGENDAETLAALARWVREAHHHAAPGDLAWARLLRWRQLAAEFFDPPSMRSVLPAVGEVDITLVEETPSSEALLLAGWLASRLRWRLLDVTREGTAYRAVYRSADHFVDLRLRRAAPPADGAAGVPSTVQSLTLRAGGDETGYVLHVERAPGTGAIRATAGAAGQSGEARGASLSEAPEDTLLADLLDVRGRDPVYEAALARAAELAASAAQ